mmetsp:Transcript_20507/g.46547  ORF Transcript_20507/g.46547 Transcript_20507/m.46547 type:complete len:128 (-) Transcript_20507:135-518(-)
MTEGSGKLRIATSTHTSEELASILEDYTAVGLASSKQLFGGYSASTYLLTLQDESKLVLKVCNGYTVENAESMCQTAAYLESVGYKDCCFPLPKLEAARKDDDRHASIMFTSLKERKKSTFISTEFC